MPLRERGDDGMSAPTEPMVRLVEVRCPNPQCWRGELDGLTDGIETNYYPPCLVPVAVLRDEQVCPSCKEPTLFATEPVED